MHELSLLAYVREALESHAASMQFTQVTRLTLEIGKLSSVEPEALRFGFDVVMKGSLAENAELLIVETEGLGQCKHCGRQAAIETLYDPCPACGRPIDSVLQGTEMKIKDLIVI